MIQRWQRTTTSRPRDKAHLFKHTPWVSCKDRYASLCGGHVVLSPLALEEVADTWPRCKVCEKRAVNP